MGEFLTVLYKVILIAWTCYSWSRYSKSNKSVFDKILLFVGFYLSAFFIELYVGTSWLIRLF